MLPLCQQSLFVLRLIHLRQNQLWLRGITENLVGSQLLKTDKSESSELLPEKRIETKPEIQK